MLICPLCEETVDPRDMRHMERGSQTVIVCGECYETLLKEMKEVNE